MNPEINAVTQAAKALSTSVLPVRDPLVDGITCDKDVPFAIHHELMQAAIDKSINLSWLCAIYRAGFEAGYAWAGGKNGERGK